MRSSTGSFVICLVVAAALPALVAARAGAQPAPGASSEEHVHDHAADHAPTAEPATPSRLAAWLGKLHPVTVHFPLALLTTAALCELLVMLGAGERFAHAGQVTAVMGGVSALAAAALGWFAGGFQLTDPSWITTTHRWLGTTTAALAVAVALLCVAGRRRAYRVTLFIAALTVSAAGFFGGALIYGLDHLMW